MLRLDERNYPMDEMPIRLSNDYDRDGISRRESTTGPGGAAAWVPFGASMFGQGKCRDG